jgi:LmbE family N-acetylglucosaminyl deacetylase
MLAFSMAGKAVFHRRFRSPVPLRRIAVAVSAALLVANMTAFVLGLQGFWHAADLTVTAAGLTATAIPMALMRIRVSPAAQQRRVLAIGAHPDDIELACGGTLAKFVDSGHEVQVLVMSDGKQGGDVDARSGDARRGAGFIGLAGLQHFSFTDADLASHAQEMIRVIEESIVRFNPDIILTHSQHDHHQDHQAVHTATLRAARRHSSILCYESPSATRDFDPSVFVDIDDYMEVKVRAVQMHIDQRDKPYMCAERIRGTAVFRGAQARRKLAEAYEPVRMLDTEVGRFDGGGIRHG